MSKVQYAIIDFTKTNSTVPSKLSTNMQSVRSATVLGDCLGRKDKAEYWDNIWSLLSQRRPTRQTRRQVTLGNGVSAGQEWFQCDFNRKSGESGQWLDWTTGQNDSSWECLTEGEQNRGRSFIQLLATVSAVRAVSCQDMMIRPRPELETVQNILKSCSTIYTNTA